MKSVFTLACALAGFLTAFTAPSHSQPAPRPQFEVVSIKPDPADGQFSIIPERTPGRLRWTTQLVYLIGYAYGLDFTHVSGARIGGEIYFIDATFQPSAGDAQVRLMIQSLLADRFQMRAHPVTTQADGFGLTIAKGGSKLKPADESASGPSLVSPIGVARGVIQIIGRKASIAQLATTLARNLGQPVWDQTGLTGIYDFTFRYSQEADVDIPVDAPSLATALREDLGLTLQKQKGPVESLVVDNIQPPSEN